MGAREDFIERIANAVKVLAPKYGINVVSPIVAQACLETGYGVGKGAEVKVAHHNYFGLKYRKNRVTCHTGFFRDGSQEQKKDGTYVPIVTDWYAFADLFSGVEGYFQFINTANYANLKGVTDPHQYLVLIKEDNYATSLDYVENVWRVVQSNNLTRYDCKEEFMGYTNSPLIDCTRLSPNHSGERTHKIDRITPHCVVGQLSAERIGDCFPNGRGASCNYGVGYDGRQCLIVEEKNRSWCTSSNENDQRAITIEVASDKTAPYTFTNEAYAGLVELCIDICRRNSLRKVLWLGTKEESLSYEPKNGECVLTVHRWFANKSCPGDWMYARMPQLVADINKELGREYDVGNSSVIIKVPNDGKILYRVQCGAYKNKNNAENQLAKIESCGVDAFITQVDGLYKVQVGAYGIKQNAKNQLDRMKALGFDCFIAEIKMESESFVPRKSYEEIAKEIWTGKCSDSRWNTWGDGETRKERLKAAGYNYDSVQEAIEKLYR